VTNGHVSQNQQLKMLLSIDEMHECIAGYLREAGYEEGAWTWSGKYDTGMSTRITVHGMSYTNAAGLVPSSAQMMKIQEGWTRHGGMEFGSVDVLAEIWLQDNNRQAFDYARIESKEALLQYMRSRFPAGEALVEAMRTATVAQRAMQLRAEQEALNDSIVRNCCISSERLKSLVEDALQNAAARGLDQRTFPKLKERLTHHLTSQIRDAVARY
jgi:hypothetical protein